MIYGQKYFDQLVKKYLKKSYFQKIAAGQGDNYTTVCLLCYP